MFLMLIGPCFGVCLIDYRMIGSAIKTYMLCSGKFLVLFFFFLLYLLANADIMYCIEVIHVIFTSCVKYHISGNNVAFTTRRIIKLSPYKYPI